MEFTDYLDVSQFIIDQDPLLQDIY